MIKYSKTQKSFHPLQKCPSVEIIYILGGTKIKANILSGSFAGNCIIVQNKIKMSIVYCYMLHLKYKAKMHKLQKDNSKKYVDTEST